MELRAVVSVAVVLGIAAICVGGQPVQPAVSSDAGPLQVLKSFKVSGPGRWDYLTVDPEAHRLYVSHGTSVVVVDANNGTPIGEIADTQGVHGIALVPEDNIGFTSNGRGNDLTVFDLKTLKTIKTVKAGRNPDSIIYDPFSKRIFAFNHSGGDITVVDPKALDKEPVTIAVGGTLETGVSNGAGHVYVNVEDKSEVVPVDSREDKVLAHWPLTPAEGPTGLAIDTERHRLFCGCDRLMVVLDPEQGKILATVPTGAGVDGVAFDPKLGVAVSANGRDGTATVVKEEPAGTFKAIQTLATARGARTITCDTKNHLFYMPCNIITNGQTEFSVLVLGAKPQ
jgi:DNA-binding beta-propeller fold protein YncE